MVSEKHIIGTIINRELNMQCLGCGRSLRKEIMNKDIHIHLCKDCRMRILDTEQKLIKERLKELTKQTKLKEK